MWDGVTAYGVSPRRFQALLRFDYGIKVSEKESARFINGWWDTYSQVAVARDAAIERCREHGYVETIFGRRRRLPKIWSSDEYERGVAERRCWNFTIQGAVGDLMKRAMIRIHERIRPLGAYLILQVHDEIIAEAPDEHAEEVQRIMKEEMENVAKLKVPLVADIKIGTKWSETH